MTPAGIPCGVSDRVRRLKAKVLEAVPELFPHRALLVTESVREQAGRPPLLQRALAAPAGPAPAVQRQAGPAPAHGLALHGLPGSEASASPAEIDWGASVSLAAQPEAAPSSPSAAVTGPLAGDWTCFGWVAIATTVSSAAVSASGMV